MHECTPLPKHIEIPDIDRSTKVPRLPLQIRDTDRANATKPLRATCKAAIMYRAALSPLCRQYGLRSKSHLQSSDKERVHLDWNSSAQSLTLHYAVNVGFTDYFMMKGVPVLVMTWPQHKRNPGSFQDEYPVTSHG